MRHNRAKHGLLCRAAIYWSCPGVTSTGGPGEPHSSGGQILPRRANAPCRKTSQGDLVGRPVILNELDLGYLPLAIQLVPAQHSGNVRSERQVTVPPGKVTSATARWSPSTKLVLWMPASVVM